MTIIHIILMAPYTVYEELYLYNNRRLGIRGSFGCFSRIQNC